MKDTPIIDTSKMSKGERDALELTESARDSRLAGGRSFAGSLFMGHPDFSRAFPFPARSLEDRDQGDAFLAKLQSILANLADPDEIDSSGEIPDDLISALAGIGAFGIKIPTRFGGLGLSQTNYVRAAMLLGGTCGNLTALLSAHQSIGVPQPLLQFGTEEQKRRFLPRCAAGDISAFALTETEVGSDPARMKTSANPTADGSAYILDGEKLWCTNGTKAGLVVVMARTPWDGSSRNKTPITAFIVEMDSPGVEVVRRCHFMGLRALYNGVLKFHRVRVPADNIIGDPGNGLKVALSTLNTGRVTLPAACAGLAKRCLDITTRWASKRTQWGAPIAKHAAVADKIAGMAADAYAMEATALFVAGLIDQNKDADIRVEAAMAKLWATERAWTIVDDTLQIRGGRGYETAASLTARGDSPDPVERLFRDSRINRIFEGSTEIMHLFIAREALDPHLRLAAPAMNSQLPAATRLRTAARASAFYSLWYPRLWIPAFFPRNPCHLAPDLAREWRTIRRLSRILARRLFHQMAKYGPKLDKQQVLLGRFVDIGTELFVMATTLSYAHFQSPGHKTRSRHASLAVHFCKIARLRIARLFHDIGRNLDPQNYRIAQDTVFPDTQSP